MHSAATSAPEGRLLELERRLRALTKTSHRLHLERVKHEGEYKAKEVQEVRAAVGRLFAVLVGRRARRGGAQLPSGAAAPPPTLTPLPQSHTTNTSTHNTNNTNRRSRACAAA